MKTQTLVMSAVACLVVGQAHARFLSVDPVPANPNTGWNFNRYQYANSNPYKYIDPDGRYSCLGGKSDCDFLNKVVDDARKASENLPSGSQARNSTSEVLGFIGKAGDNNGVFLQIKDSSGYGETKTVGKLTFIDLNKKAMADGNGGTENSNFRNEAAATLMHEGRHGFDQNKNGMPSNRAEMKQHELRAARTEAHTWRGLNADSSWGTWTTKGGYNNAEMERQAESSTALWCSNGGGC